MLVLGVQNESNIDGKSLKGDQGRPRGRRGPIETALWWCAGDEKCEPENVQKNGKKNNAGAIDPKTSYTTKKQY